MFGKLLVALDGTDVAQTILPFASQLAMGLDVPLVLFSAVQGGEQTEEESYGDLYEKDAQAARSRLNELCEELSAQGVDTQIALAVGSPAEQIVAAANERGCGLIAMSTHGRNLFARGILGSVTSKVIHDTDTPVLTITPEKAELYRDHQLKLTRTHGPARRVAARRDRTGPMSKSWPCDSPLRYLWLESSRRPTYSGWTATLQASGKPSRPCSARPETT